ncbi:MAG: molybdate transport system substrate-binding protein [Alphaproteobacteria bacterium]|nr:molybdate transport system substrate-binding protein [Alphaproteobacteria bacterium]
MSKRLNMLGAGLVAVFGLWGQGAAQAADVIIYANQGAASGIKDLAAGYEKATGNKVVIVTAQGAAFMDKINANEPGDVVTGFLPAGLDDLVKRGKAVDGTVVEFARAGNGVAVKEGARKWDISTSEGFKRAMLDAKSIMHSNAGTGPYNTPMFQKLGIYDQIKDKIKISEGRPVASYVASGEVEIGIQQTNVIQPFPGTVYLGPLPPDLIEYGRFAAAVMTVSKDKDAAKALIKFMVDPANAALVRKSAMEPPAR